MHFENIYQALSRITGYQKSAEPVAPDP